jgi:hypothetical protein
MAFVGLEVEQLQREELAHLVVCPSDVIVAGGGVFLKMDVVEAVRGRDLTRRRDERALRRAISAYGQNFRCLRSGESEAFGVSDVVLRSHRLIGCPLSRRSHASAKNNLLWHRPTTTTPIHCHHRIHSYRTALVGHILDWPDRTPGEAS